MPLSFILSLLAGAAIGLFVWGCVRLLTAGWARYEKKYVEGAEETLDSMFITIPTRHLLYMSLGGVFFGGGLIYFVSGSLFISIVAAVFFLLLPTQTIKMLKKRRSRRFIEQLPDALRSMSNSLKSGFSIPQAVGLIGAEMDNPLKQEFKLVGQEMQLGIPLEEAMGHLEERMPSQEIQLVVASIIIARTVGGNLSEILGTIADTIRERLKVEGRIRSLTAQGKLQGIVMCAMPFFLAFMYYLVAPSFIRPVFTEAAGFILLGIIVVLEVLGILVIRKVVQVDI